MKILVTGGAGFIGSNFCRLFHKDYKITVFDKLTYCGLKENLKGLDVKFIKGDIADQAAVRKAMKKQHCVINFAAESHVDQSIYRPQEFTHTNVCGTTVLLHEAMEANIHKFIHISTDEVYGSLNERDESSTEGSMLAPNSPYSASKAASDLLCRSFSKTYDFPVIITRSSNNYGPYQFPEKLMPLMITNAMDNIELPVYGRGLNIRDWLYVEDNCRAIELILRKGNLGEIYNISSNAEFANIDIVKGILTTFNKSKKLIRYVQDRPGHDFRYSLNSDKLTNELGWRPKTFFGRGIERTVDWYINNRSWWEKIKKKKEFHNFQKKHYR